MTDKEDCCVSGNCCGGSDVDSQSEHLTCNDKSDDQTSDCGGEDCCSPNADTGKRTGLDEAQDAMSDICCDAEGICGSANTTHVGGGVNANPVQRCGEVVIAKQINVEVREAPCAKACCPTTNNNGSTLASETQGSDKCSTGPPAKPSDGCCSSSGPVGAIATTGCQELAKATGAENQDCCGNRSTTSPLEVDEQDSQCEEGCCDDDSDESAIVEPLGTTKVAEEKGCCATETKGAGGCCGLKKPKAKPVKVMKADNSCACCMKTLLNQSATSLRMLTSRVSELQSELKRCCLVFQEVCCRQYRMDQLATASTCCVTDCSEETSLLGYASGSSHPANRSQTEVEKQEPDVNSSREQFTLEITGMDCPDCLNKVKRAFKSFKSAEYTRMDYIRGLVDVEYNPNDIEPDGIARFVARASGFGVTVLNSTSKTDGSTLVLPVHFEILPPADPLAKYDHRPVHVARDIKAGDIEFFIPGNGSDNPEPRRLLREMERYRPSLVSSTSDRHRKRIDRDATLVALRTAASAVLTVPISVLVWATKLPDHGSIAYRAAEFALATGILVVAEPIYSGSFRSVWYLHEADLGVLTTVSTLVTYIFSAVAFAFQVAGRPFADPFFETLALLITLVFLGRTLQAYTRKAAYIATTQVSTLQPAQATVVNESQGRDPLLETVDARLLHYDDIIRIESGQVVPTDGIIVTGTADLDEATMTGESLPVTRTTGSTAMAGTTVLQGTIDICVTRLTCNNSLSSMVQALSRAQNSTSKYQDFADRMASILLPIASGIAIASCVIWLLVSHYVRDRTWADSAVEGVRYLIAVMAVACPCALALAVSLVSCLAMVIGMKAGVIYRSPDVLFAATKAKVIAFDKTGTLSQGVLSVVQDASINKLATQLVHEVTGLTRHPISVAVQRHIEGQQHLGHQEKVLLDAQIVPGGGISASYLGFPILAGSAAFTGTMHNPLVRALTNKGLSLFTVTLGGCVIASYGLLDQPRMGTAQMLNSLSAQGKHIFVLSGDNINAVHRFADSIDLDKSRAFGGLSPTQKAQKVRELQDGFGSTMFVGDGTNDSLALEQASISVAIGTGSGSDIAIATASIILLASDVMKGLEKILSISKLARRHVYLTLGWCAVYFVFAILLASGAVVKFTIPPEWAGLGEVISILPVLAIGGALWLRKQ